MATQEIDRALTPEEKIAMLEGVLAAIVEEKGRQILSPLGIAQAFLNQRRAEIRFIPSSGNYVVMIDGMA